MVCETSGVKTYETPNFPYALPLSPNTPQIPYFSHSFPNISPKPSNLNTTFQRAVCPAGQVASRVDIGSVTVYGYETKPRL